MKHKKVEDGLICEHCATSHPDDGVELRDCDHVLCEDCYGGACPICAAEASPKE